MAVMLMGLVFAAAGVESSAQPRRKDDRKPAATTNHSKPAARPVRPDVKPGGGPAAKPSGPATKPGGPTTKPGGPATKPGGGPSTKPGSGPAMKPPGQKPGGPATKPGGPATRPGGGPSSKPGSGPAMKPPGQKPGGPAARPGKPTTRPGGPASRPIYGPGHKPGYRPAPRPPRPPKPVIVVRPRYGTILAANLTALLVRDAVRSAARNAYGSYAGLSLKHSYISSDTEYYYQDGVFYIVDAYGQFMTIIPPTGALVEYLPEDYTTFRRSGELFYRVDDTVYALRLIDGQPLFEVLGQVR